MAIQEWKVTMMNFLVGTAISIQKKWFITLWWSNGFCFRPDTSCSML